MSLRPEVDVSLNHLRGTAPVDRNEPPQKGRYNYRYMYIGYVSSLVMLLLSDKIAMVVYCVII